VADDHDYYHPTNRLFPNIRAVIQTMVNKAIKGEVSVFFIKPVSYRCLFLHLLRIPFHHSAKDASDPPTLPVLNRILLATEGTGTLHGFESLQLSDLDWSRHSPFHAPGLDLRAMYPISRKGPFVSTGPTGTKRWIDTLFGLVRLAGYARSLVPESERVQQTLSGARITCELSAGQLFAFAKEVSSFNRERCKKSETGLKYSRSIRG
jgi:hypothetical protein